MAQAREQGHEERNDQVELLLDAEGPGHEKWTEAATRVEVVVEAKKGDVGGGEGGSEGVASQEANFVGGEKHKPGGKCEEQDGVEGGKDAAGAVLIKAEVSKGARAEGSVDLAADQRCV